jgi:hypothetical protein
MQTEQGSVVQVMAGQSKAGQNKAARQGRSGLSKASRKARETMQGRLTGWVWHNKAGRHVG